MVHFFDYWKKLHENQRKEKVHRELMQQGALKLNAFLEYIFVSKQKKQEYNLPDICKNLSHENKPHQLRKEMPKM